MDADLAIPLIDFDQFLNGSIADRHEVASAIDTAFRSLGFIYMSNHGIDKEKVDECFEWVSLLPSLTATQRAFPSSLPAWLPSPRRFKFSKI